MKSTFAVILIAWSVLCALLGFLAMPELRSHFSENEHYFVWLRSPEKLTGSPEDTDARGVLEEAARRGILKPGFFEALKQKNGVSGVYVEHLKVAPEFYWLYALGVIVFWGLPSLIVSLAWVATERKRGLAP